MSPYPWFAQVKRLLAVAMLGLLLLFNSKPADAEDSLNDADLMPMDETILFEEIASVFTASKYEQKVTEAPSSISIITADEIKKYGYRNLAEVLRSVRGLHVTNDRNYSYLGVRGFGLPSDYNNRVLLLIDGIRTNDSIYGSSSLGAAFQVDLDLVDRIEIVRGPSSSLYGSNAFFGVINVMTKRGRDLQGLELSVEGGSFEQYKGRATYGNRLGSGLELLLSASYFDTQGDDLNYNEFLDAHADTWWYLFDDNGIGDATVRNLDYDRSKQFMAELQYHEFTLQAIFSERKKGIPTGAWETVLTDQGTFSIDRQWWVDLKYEHLFDAGLTTMARISYTNYDYTGDYILDGTVDEDYLVTVRNDDGADGRWIFGEVQASGMIGSHRLVIGASMHNNVQQDQYTFYIDSPEFWGELDDVRDSINWSLFVQDEVPLSDTIKFNGGVRYDSFDIFGSTTNPRAALIYSPVKRTTFKAVYGEAFRSPNTYELYFDDGVYSKGNPDLDAETINTYELIYEQYIGHVLRGTVVGFYYTVDNLIQQETDPIDELLVFNNVDEVDAYGVEAELEGKWENGITGRLSFAYQETENQATGRQLSNSPLYLIKLNLILPLWQDRLWLGLEEQYTSKRRTLYREKNEADNDTYADAYFVTNVTLFSHALSNNLELSASVYNLLDEEYDDPGAGEHLMDMIQQDGRTFRFKMTYLF